MFPPQRGALRGGRRRDRVSAGVRSPWQRRRSAQQCRVQPPGDGGDVHVGLERGHVVAAWEDDDVPAELLELLAVADDPPGDAALVDVVLVADETESRARDLRLRRPVVEFLQWARVQRVVLA